MANSRATVIKNKLEERPSQSKKAIYAFITGTCVLLVFVGSSFLILTHAEAAKEIVELANLVVLFFGALATTLITGQAAMDWKAMSALTHMDEDERQEEVVESNQPVESLEVGRVHKPRYYDDLYDR